MGARQEHSFYPRLSIPTPVLSGIQSIYIIQAQVKAINPAGFYLPQSEDKAGYYNMTARIFGAKL